MRDKDMMPKNPSNHLELLLNRVQDLKDFRKHALKHSNCKLRRNLLLKTLLVMMMNRNA